MLDILSNHSFSGVGATFTVVASPLTVAVLTPDAAGLYLTNPTGLAWFEPGDNLVLTGVLAKAEYGFGEAQGNHSVSFYFEDSLGNFYTLSELGGLSYFAIPMLCEMVEIPPSGLYIRVPTTHGRLRLVIRNINLNVSMVNVPTGLVGQSLLVIYSLRINHTLPMAVAP